MNYDDSANFVTHGGALVKQPEATTDKGPLPYADEFEQFWDRYPKRTGMNSAVFKNKVMVLWRKAIEEQGYTGRDQLRALEEALTDKTWVDSNYQKAKRIDKWFEDDLTYTFLYNTSKKRTQTAFKSRCEGEDEEDYPELTEEQMRAAFD